MTTHAAALKITHGIAASKKWKKLRKQYAKNRQGVSLTAFLLAIMALTQIEFLLSPTFGVYSTVTMLAMLLLFAVQSKRWRELAIAIAILPVATMINLSLPQVNDFSQAIVFYNAILFLTLVYRFLFTLDAPTKRTSLGLKAYALLIPLMIVAGQAFGAIAFGLFHSDYPFAGIPLPMASMCIIFFAFAEEMLFRGLIQQRAAHVLHPVLAAVLSAGLYALFSISLGSVAGFVFALATGAALSTVYFYKENVILTTTMNVTAKLLYIGLLATFVI